MRRSGFSLPLFFFAIVLGGWISMSPAKTDRFRSFSTATLMPAWNLLHRFQKYLSDRPTLKTASEVDSQRLAALELENILLRSQVEKFSKWLSAEEEIDKKWDLFQKIEKKAKESLQTEDRLFFERRAQSLLSLIRSQLIAMPAEVIYRSPSSWGNSLWINIGEAHNRVLGSKVIAKNSPVIAQGALIGVIEYVGEAASRVRLITDSELISSVRAVRGEKYLAKGELRGSSSCLWRTLSPSLKGVGFNLAFADEEKTVSPETILLQEGDALVTTGFDGVFPPDLPVGIVTKVFPSSFGVHLYDIDVQLLAQNLWELGSVFVLPPRGE
jgi:rod shape-determining protein MreC